MEDTFSKNTFQINRDEFIKFAKEAPNKHFASNQVIPDIKSENRFIFFLLDIVEWNVKQPGHIYLFGKTYDYAEKSYVSCCVSIEYCYKKVYLLPRESFSDDPSRKVSFQDICDEFSKEIVPQIETCEVEYNQVRKKYAFDDNVPAEADYLEIKCKVGNFKLRDNPGNTYSKMLGTNIGYKETFVLERNIKGPCWLEIENYKTDLRKQSHCKINIECYDIQDVTPITCGIIPPITLMGLEFKTVKHKGDEENIVSISCIVETFTKIDVEASTAIIDKFCILSTEHCSGIGNLVQEYAKNFSDANIHLADDEVHLLRQFFGCIHRFDPDILYGHDMIGHNVDLIYSKIVQNQMVLKNYCKIPKIMACKVPPAKYKIDLFIGRILCDTKIIAEEMVKSRSYSIHDLSVDILEIPHCDLQNDLFLTAFRDINKLSDFIYSVLWDITCVYKFLEKFNVMELIIEISRLCGNTLKSSCDGYLSSQCEYLLLHKYHEMNYIVPSRYVNRSKKKIMSLIGGLVLEPEVGLHKDFVLAMDFNALYPSIIREYNVCFTTLKSKDGKYVEVNGEGVLSQLIGELLCERKTILHELHTVNGNEENNFVQNLQIKQQVIKRMTNSIYGYIGCDGSRFMAEHIANFITEKGRLILSNTVALLTDDSYRVIYGDTDSVMIQTNLKTYGEVEVLSRVLTDKINSQYKFVNIEQAGIYKPLLILRKKKYAGMRINSNGSSYEEIKGLDVVRRDWSAISSVVAKTVLRYILTDVENLNNTICSYLVDKRQDMLNNYHNYNDELFMICKKLSKDPEKYNKANYEHVKLAQEYNKKYPNKFRVHDIVCYVVCVDGTSKCYLDRVYLIEEYKKSSELKIDVEYYISQQIYPVVKRVCDSIKGAVTKEDLLTALSIDSDKYKTLQDRHCKTTEVAPAPKYNPLYNFIFRCSKCEMDCLFCYESLQFIKTCDCSENVFENYETKVVALVNNISKMYKSKNRTFKETDNILSKLQLSSSADTHYFQYLKFFDDCRKILLEDFDCKNLDPKDMFKYCCTSLKL